MADWRDKLHKPSIKYAVVAVAVANCGGIYLAKERLNRPQSAPVTETFVAAADYVDMSASQRAPAAESPPALVNTAPRLAADISAEATRLVRGDSLPAMASLPPLRVEAAPVIPSVPARAVRLGISQTTRAARVQPARRAPAVQQPEQGFETAFKPDYATLAPYDGSAEANSVGDTVQDARAMGAEEVRAESLSIDTSMSAGPFPANSGAASAPAQEAPAPVELPTVQLTAPVEQLPG